MSTRSSSDTRLASLRSSRLSRRQLLSATAVAVAGVAVGSPRRDTRGQAGDVREFADELRDVRTGALNQLRNWWQQQKVFREDGYFYTIDAAQLLLCFTHEGDEQTAGPLREHCLKHLISNDPSRPFIRGFVPWRWKPGVEPDASGTTEGLRVAKAFWLGSRAFNRPQDVETARMVMAGYAQHATVDQDIWIIRNYFNYNRWTFATNSFLVDYDPDFVREIADGTQDVELSKLADHCVGVISKAVTPAGLLYDLVQPELRTLYPLLNVYTYSPNDVVGISNCATAAACCAKTLPQAGKNILAFAMRRLSNLRRYYYGRTGEPVDDVAAAVFEYSILSRLAALLEDNASAARLVERALPQWQWIVGQGDPKSLFLFTEIVLNVDTLLA